MAPLTQISALPALPAREFIVADTSIAFSTTPASTPTTHLVFEESTMTTIIDPPGRFALDEVSWYWIVLGIAVPALLIAVFCAMDSRHKRHGAKPSRSSRRTEATLDCLCEQNKLVPPCYADVAASPSQIATIAGSSFFEGHADRSIRNDDETISAGFHRTFSLVGRPNSYARMTNESGPSGAGAASPQHWSSTSKLSSAMSCYFRGVNTLYSTPAISPASSTTSMIPPKPSPLAAPTSVELSHKKIKTIRRPSSSPQLSSLGKMFSDVVGPVPTRPSTVVHATPLVVSILSDSNFGKVCSVERAHAVTPQFYPDVITPPPYEEYEYYSKVNVGSCFEPPQWG